MYLIKKSNLNISLFLIAMDMNGAVDPVTRQRTPASSRPNLSSPTEKGPEGSTVQLHKRVGLLSGIALIAGTMIGKLLSFIRFFFFFGLGGST